MFTFKTLSCSGWMRTRLELPILDANPGFVVVVVVVLGRLHLVNRVKHSVEVAGLDMSSICT